MGREIHSQDTGVRKRTSEGIDVRYLSQLVVSNVEKSSDLLRPGRWKRSGGQVLDEPGGS